MKCFPMRRQSFIKIERTCSTKGCQGHCHLKMFSLELPHMQHFSKVQKTKNVVISCYLYIQHCRSLLIRKGCLLFALCDLPQPSHTLWEFPETDPQYHIALDFVVVVLLFYSLIKMQQNFHFFVKFGTSIFFFFNLKSYQNTRILTRYTLLSSSLLKKNRLKICYLPICQPHFLNRVANSK